MNETIPYVNYLPYLTNIIRINFIEIYYQGTVRNAARNRHNEQQQQANLTQPQVRHQQQIARSLNQQNTNQQLMGPSLPQQILEHPEENLSDKEIYPGK